jgi:hypothetical protein
MKHLQALSMLLSDSHPINGYSEEAAARKRVYEMQGKRAMKELAVLLELIEYDISFNRAGMACSGDLRLMGFNRHGSGVYIYLNKDLGKTELLYRTIEHMKDFSGGRNRYLPFTILGDQEGLEDSIGALLT